MPSMQLFELDDTLEPGHSARARLLSWTGSEYNTRGAKSIIVYSFAGAHGVPGDRGYCFLGESNRWEVVGDLVNRGGLG